MSEWAKSYRPSDWGEIVGQKDAVTQIRNLLKKGFPRTVALIGPSGTGKSTLARIIMDKVGVVGKDLSIIDCAALKDPSDEMREIKDTAGYGSLHGKRRGWIFEEFQSLSRAGFAQQATLVFLEAEYKTEPQFIITTTDPSKIAAAVLSRCQKINLRPVDAFPLKDLAERVLKEENVTVSEQVLKKVVEGAGGSARVMLTDLERVAALDTEEEQLNALSDQQAEAAGIDLCRALIDGKGWGKVRDILSRLGEDPEKVRRGILGYAQSCLLKPTAPKKLTDQAFLMIQCFRDPLYDSGKPGLAANCYEMCGK